MDSTAHLIARTSIRDQVPLVPAELASVILESLFYGAFLVLFIACMYVLIRRPHVPSGPGGPKLAFNKVMFSAAVFLFLAITAHWLVQVLRAFDAFVNFLANPGPIAFYADLANAKNVTKTGLIILIYLIGDTIMVYRLYIVWNGNIPIILIPFCSVLGLLVCGTGITYQFSRVTSNECLVVSECQRWITSSFIFTLITNIYSSPMIAFRIWRSVKWSGSKRLTPVIHVVVESAAFYTAWTFATFIAYITGSNLQFPGLDATSPVIGIVFCVIIVRVGLGVGPQAHASKTSQRWFLSSTANRSMTSTATATASATDYRMQPLAINVTRHTEGPEYYLPDGKNSDAGGQELPDAPPKVFVAE